jgi:hypothetical protein
MREVFGSGAGIENMANVGYYFSAAVFEGIVDDAVRAWCFAGKEDLYGVLDFTWSEVYGLVARTGF